MPNGRSTPCWGKPLSTHWNEGDALADEDFDGMGAAAEATLPGAWRIDRQTSAPRTVGTYAAAETETMYAGGNNLPSNAKNGTWNFRADGSDNRAVGGISTGVANGTRCVNVYAHTTVHENPLTIFRKPNKY